MAPLNLGGTPLAWDESKPYLRRIREAGIKQFIELYRAVHNSHGAELLWGDEIEYHVMRVEGSAEDGRRTVKLSLRAPELLEQLVASEGSDPRRYDGCSWHAEYGRWMVEATPREPFGGYSTELLKVERSMRLRRQRLLSMLRSDEIIPTIPTFPLMGVGDFTFPPAAVNGPSAASHCVPDEAITPHVRMLTLTANIRKRRGSNVDVHVPLFRDVATPEFKGAIGADPVAPPPEVHGDAMAFGMGSCCLQVTFQARDVNESRFLTDQLAVLAPIMLALTAGTPVFRGRLVDTDVRWAAISMSVDDRTAAERRPEGAPVPADAAQLELAGEGTRRMAKSRYASISHYIYDCPVARMHGKRNPIAVLNDLEMEVDPDMYRLLREGGIDEMLATHVAYNFSRDPLVMFRERVDELEYDHDTDLFESLQSTNWNSVRWKPPPSLDSPIGWRTEFRSMEVQMTDFENAAFTTLMMLLTRTILAFDLDLLIPMSLVDLNMDRAHARDAVLREKFHFRKHLVTPNPHPGGNGDVPHAHTVACGGHYSFESEEMTIAEILSGKGTYFPGLLPLCNTYLESIACDAATKGEVHRYMKLIAMRANGSLLTNAAWQRQFITSHVDYLSDSVVSSSIAHDLMVAVHEIGIGKRKCKEVLGEVAIEPILPVDAWDVKLESSRVDGTTRCKLLQQYMQRPAFLTRLKTETTDESLPDVTSPKDGGRPPRLPPSQTR